MHVSLPGAMVGPRLPSVRPASALYRTNWENIQEFDLITNQNSARSGVALAKSGEAMWPTQYAE